MVFGTCWRQVVDQEHSRVKQTSAPHCLYANSQDLLTWENVHALRLMRDVCDEAGRLAWSIWAPEWFVDRTAGETVVFWSSSFEDAGWKKSRL